MKPPTLDERGDELRRAMAERRVRLDSALARLREAAAERFTVGGRLARDPWLWLLGACAAGLVLGMRGRSK
jgi:hypothetical protein